MDAVLGLSMTPTSVGLVLVEGQDADGATMDRDSIAFTDGDVHSSQQATAAVLRTEAIAATRGLRLHSIGVTWSEDADLEASMLMESLTESGFDNVVAIRMPEATEALARGIADVLGYATTAVCVIEPESVISLIVNTSDGAVQTAFNHSVDSDDALISWLSSVFTRADWAPEALVVVGSAGDHDPVLHQLEDALSVPVYAPEEAKLALARGAALASAQSTEMPRAALDDAFVVQARSDRAENATRDTRNARRRSLATAGPLAMLAVGAVTFVVSVSLAVSTQLTPTRTAQPMDRVPAVRAETPAAVRPVPPAAPPPPVAVPQEPVVEAAPPPPPEAPAPVSDEAPVAVVDSPAEAPPVDEAPAAVPDAPAEAPAPVDPALAPPMVGTPLPPNVAPPYVAPVPTKKPGILTRIKEKLTPGPG
ncbi:hypothetical protein CIW49_20165 [Mycolicibacterium sp. P1-18]|uniref:DUF7159 family protein n=1 Tax=Mycolicibacterium sp. P1-18 TaxID=2024615 RepID=UPI0011F3EEFD|nr:hypothetical protein [Mycolicibacterium sp. P1-18]KAA0095891.1 hypothetical protein CIW49_20165 [Mycolicibacterium sp. P1-18]